MILSPFPINRPSWRCRYNKINTFWSCENNVTLHELKNALGFRGWVMSDWVSRHDIADIWVAFLVRCQRYCRWQEAAHSRLSIMRGLDQEMPGYGGAGPAMGTSKIRGGLANHTITLAAIDDAVSPSDHDLSVYLISRALTVL